MNPVTFPWISVFWCNQDFLSAKGGEGFQVVIIELSHRSRAESRENKIRINRADTSELLVRLEYKPELFATHG